MAIFKITNITNTLGKRDANYNSKLKLSFVDNLVLKVQELLPNTDMYYNGPSLPVSIHKLRAKKLVTVNEISEKELLKSQPQNKRIVKSKEVKPVVSKEKLVPAQPKKKVYKKKIEEK